MKPKAGAATRIDADVLDGYLKELHATEAKPVVSPVETFLAALSRMSPQQREMTMTELVARVCIFCGVADPGCDCWEREEEEVPS